MNIKLKTEVKDFANAETIFNALLTARGFTTKAQQDAFLHPPVPTLDFLLHESSLEKAVLDNSLQLLNSHLKSNHDILVFGDYDADGVTATAIMWQAITAYAKQSQSSSHILPFIPDRHRHGYGLSEKAVAEVIGGEAFQSTQYPDFAPHLIITVDTGIVAHLGIQTFHDQGIDVLITDHHVPEASLPKASCILHSTLTSGAGLAWIFSLYLLGDPAKHLLDLATIGVVGDMLPLTGLNRSLVAHGLRELSQTRRPGIMAMKKAMGIVDKSLTTYDISFGIAPRINATGRIYNPLDALRLLCTSDSALATTLAAKIESHNHDRQEFTDRALALAGKEQSDHKIIVIIGDYHEGVIGLVAGKLVEMFHKPAVVMSDNGEVIKGSARSLPGVNITEMLRSLKTSFLGLGGHEQAAGFSLEKLVIPAFTHELETLADQQIDSSLLTKSEVVDLEVPLSASSLKLAQLIHNLEPFGIGNPKPKFLFRDLVVLEDRELGKEGKHHKLTVEQNGVTREVLMFNTKHAHPLKHIKALICTLDINLWREKESLQLIASYVES